MPLVALFSHETEADPHSKKLKRIHGQEDTNNDRITVEWTNTPDGAAKQFRREWFQGDGMVRRKNLPIEYNP
uniref:MSP domain-containing protein n=1 Tax=Caenorhabditis japonica TaxID=281687 RepID=A0A8R1E7G0_CAEJA